MTESKNALQDCRELSNRGHAYKLSKTAEVTGTVLAAMKVKLKAELKKQTEAAVPKKKHQDFLGLGYKTKESKALENTVTS